MQYENLCTSKSSATLGSSGGYFRKEVPSVRCILESSSRCPNILTVAPPNNLVLHVPCRPPIIPVCGRTYHAVCLKSRWGWLGTYPRSTITMELAGRLRYARTHSTLVVSNLDGTGWADTNAAVFRLPLSWIFLQERVLCLLEQRCQNSFLRAERISFQSCPPSLSEWRILTATTRPAAMSGGAVHSSSIRYSGRTEV